MTEEQAELIWEFDLSALSKCSVEANPTLGSSVRRLTESVACSITLTVMVSGCILMKKRMVSCISTQNVANPQACDAAGDCKAVG